MSGGRALPTLVLALAIFLVLIAPSARAYEPGDTVPGRLGPEGLANRAMQRPCLEGAAPPSPPQALRCLHCAAPCASAPTGTTCRCWCTRLIRRMRSASESWGRRGGAVQPQSSAACPGATLHATARKPNRGSAAAPLPSPAWAVRLCVSQVPYHSAAKVCLWHLACRNMWESQRSLGDLLTMTPEGFSLLFLSYSGEPVRL